MCFFAFFSSSKLNDQIDKKNILELFGPPNIALCDRIIKIHDDDGDGRLQFEELRDWLVAGTLVLLLVPVL